MKKCTQKEIARKTKISQTAVSIILNGSDVSHIPLSTIRRVKKEAQKCGYFAKADKLKKKVITKNTHIAWLIGDSGSVLPQQDLSGSHYYFEFFRGITTVLRANNMQLYIYNENDFPNIAQILRDEKIAGCIITVDIKPKLLKEISELVPVVFLGRQSDHISADTVFPDNGNGMHCLMEFLTERNFTRIGFFGLKPFNYFTLTRWNAYKNYLTDRNLYDEELVFIPERIKGGIPEINYFAKEAFTYWTSRNIMPQAVVTMYDGYAFGLLHAGVSKGICIPGQISVAGFENISAGIYTNPALTTIDQKKTRMGEIAAEMLCERVGGYEGKSRKFLVEPELIERDSVGFINVNTEKAG